jgi:hypothetical protein
MKFCVENFLILAVSPKFGGVLILRRWNGLGFRSVVFQFLLLVIDPLLNQLPNTAICAFLLGFLEPLNLSLNDHSVAGRKHGSTVYAAAQIKSII